MFLNNQKEKTLLLLKLFQVLAMIDPACFSLHNNQPSITTHF